jgi:O-acetyl-ADP-ribose deacetylase (regulator of RNase III)
MTEEIKIKESKIRVVKGDITEAEVEAFVFYARPDLKLGTGYGNAISVRGGPSIQKCLDEMTTPVETGGAVVTEAGKLNAKYIVHAVGPAFQEEDIEGKLRTTVLNSLRLAEEKGIQQLAFPPMGAGFYGVALDQSAKITLGTIKDYLAGETKLQEVVVFAMDNRELKPFQTELGAISGNGGK